MHSSHRNRNATDLACALPLDTCTLLRTGMIDSNSRTPLARTPLHDRIASVTLVRLYQTQISSLLETTEMTPELITKSTTKMTVLVLLPKSTLLLSTLISALRFSSTLRPLHPRPLLQLQFASILVSLRLSH